MDKSNDMHIYAIVPRGSGKTRFERLVRIDRAYRKGLITKEQYEEMICKALVLLFGLTPDEAMNVLKHYQSMKDDLVRNLDHESQALTNEKLYDQMKGV